MASVYSTRLFRAPGFTAGPTTLYTVPAGLTIVVHSISIVWGDIIASGVDAWVQTQDLTKLCRQTLFGVPPPSPQGGTIIFNGRWVLDAGDELQAQTSAGIVDIYASGYALQS